jgi:hypothetical protein
MANIEARQTKVLIKLIVNIHGGHNALFFRQNLILGLFALFALFLANMHI